MSMFQREVLAKCRKINGLNFTNKKIYVHEQDEYLRIHVTIDMPNDCDCIIIAYNTGRGITPVNFGPASYVTIEKIKNLVLHEVRGIPLKEVAISLIPVSSLHFQ